MDMTQTDALRDWLAGIGAEECHPILSQADIDLALVGELTPEDLRELGLTLGQRKRLEKGIAALRDTGSAATPVSPAGRAERRQLSFLFCDLVGSTLLARTLDAEDLAAVQQRYQQICTRVAERWGGRALAQYGDGALLVFGHPVVHEDDARRAVHAGLELSAEIRAADPVAGVRVRSRIAIATGRVVIGDITGSSDPNSVAGETPNLAARLQDIAEPDTVVIAPSTRRLVKGAFTLQSRGAHDLKGFDAPVEAWQVLGEIDDFERGTARAGPRQIIGRENDLALLAQHWSEACAGHPQIVTLQGEPGIGKSWLISAFAEQALAATPTMRRYQNFCAAFKSNTALHPFLTEIARAAGITARDSAATVRQRIADWPAVGAVGSGNAARLVAAQLGVEDGDAPLDMTAAQQKEAMFRLLFELIEREAAQMPVLIELEDAHWADPTTLELIARIANAPPQIPIMVLMTMRPDFDPAWPDQPWISHHRLHRLPQTDALAIARQADGAHALSEARLRDIVAKADGVPLFVEELTRAVAMLDSDSVGTALDVPDTLEDSLMARLDRLVEAKAIAQIAATIGRRFRVSTLAAVADTDPARLTRLIEQLVASDILERIDDADSETCIFRHALIQDAAYGSLLRSERKQLHARIAGVLAEETHDAAMTEPEILARHYAGAEMHFEAVAKLIEAGQAATARAAQIEANNHFRAALDLLGEAPAGEATTRLAANVNALLGQSMLATVGFAAPEVGEAFARARTLSAEVGEIPLLLSSLYGVWIVAASRGERDKTRALADEALALFADSEVPLFKLSAHFMDAITRLYRGELDQAEAALEQVIALYQPEMHPYSVQAFGDDLGSYALIYLLWSHSLRGDLTTALAYSERNRVLSETLKDKQIDVRTLGFGMSGMQMVGEVDLADSMADLTIAQATDRCYPYWVAVGQLGKGWSLCHKGRAEDGLALVRAALAFFELIGQRTPLGLVHTYYAEALIASGQHDEALRILDEAIVCCHDSLDTLYLPDLMRLRGDCLAVSDPTRGEAAIREALAEAEGRGMYYFALRAAISLARLCAGTERESEARALLARIRSHTTAPMPMALFTTADALIGGE